MSARVTLRDVAHEAGVHASTASRALNPETRSVVNDETVERVLGAAERLGYRPHPLARGLRTNQTMSVGMIIPDIENPLFGPIVAGAESVLGGHGYSLLIANAEGSDEQTWPVLQALNERRVDGMIIATASRSDRALRALRDEGVHIVLVNRSTEDRMPSIVGDDHAGIGLAVRHLAELGHRRIGHVAGPQHLSTGAGRHEAFVAWMNRLDLAVEPDDVEVADWYQVLPGYEAAGRLLSRRPDLTAVVAANDLIALGTYRAVRERGGEVGVDVSVTGYNDIPLLDLMQPPMTSVRVPYRHMGVEAARMLLTIITSGPEDPAVGSVELAPTLSVRDSTGPV